MNLEEQKIVLKIVKKLEKEGKLKIKTPFHINSIEGQDKISAINIKNDDGKTEKVVTDCILGFFWFNNEIRSNC